MRSTSFWSVIVVLVFVGLYTVRSITPHRTRTPVNFILAVSDHKIKALLTQVQAKWDIITMLCLLVFCLAFAAAFYAALRPESMARKVVTFLVALGVGYG